MNIDNIKSALDSDPEGFEVPTSVDHLTTSTLPIETIRKTMKSEITAQLFIIAVMYAVFLIANLSPLAFSVYLIFITITCMFTLMYIAKLTGFLNRTSKLALNTKASIFSVIYDLKLTLEVYKTAIIAGSVILPIPTAAFLMGTKEIGDPELFEKYFLFQGSHLETLMTVAGFFALAILFYFITIWWTNKLYGIHIEELESTLEQLGD